MSVWDSVSGFSFVEVSLHVLQEIAIELKKQNHLREKEIELLEKIAESKQDKGE